MPQTYGTRHLRWSETLPMQPRPLKAAPREWPAWVWPAATLAAVAVGALTTSDAPTFYGALDKPDWAPPAWLFGPMWGLLYLMMGTAAWRVARTGHALRRSALGVYAAMLVANAGWSWLFFGLHLGGAALAGAALLLTLAASAGILFARVRSSSGWMMVPATLWVALATVLTASVWMRNPALLGG